VQLREDFEVDIGLNNKSASDAGPEDVLAQGLEGRAEFASGVPQHFLTVLLGVADDVAEVRWILQECQNMVFGRCCLGFEEGLNLSKSGRAGNP